jgi:membrane-associated phospholipid phosphatase
MPALSRRQAAAAAVSLGLVGLFAVALWLAHTGHLAGADAGVEATIVAHGTHDADVVASLIAASASLTAGGLWAILLIAVAWLRPRLRIGVLVLLVLLVAEQLVELVLKVAVDHPGPQSIGRSIFQLGSTGPQTSNSFPSGHMIRAVVLGGGTAVLAGRRTGVVVAALYMLGVAATRGYLSEHWVSDVIGGALLGAAALPLIALAAHPAAAARR